MRLCSLRLNNFKSFEGTHDLKFGQPSGLYLLTGRNEVDTDLGGNGAGKSTLMDAVFWCLYGKTTRGLKASNVKTWGTKGACSVTVEAVFGPQHVMVTRQQSPNKLVVEPAVGGDPIDCEQGYIDKLVGLNADAFMHSVVIPQFGEQFFDLSPSSKLALFSEVLDLQYWIDKSAGATKEEREFAGIVESVQRDLASSQGSLDTLNQQLALLREREKQFKAEKKRVVRSAEEIVNVQRHKYEVASKTFAKAEKDEIQAPDTTELQQARQVADTERSAKSKAALEAREKESEARGLVTAAAVAVDKLEAAMAQTKGQRTCPLCRQPVSVVHLESELLVLQKVYLKAVDVRDAAKQFSTEAKSVEADAQRACMRAEAALDKAKEASLVRRSELAQMRADMMNAKASLERAEFVLDTESKRVNPHVELIAGTVTRIEKAQQKIADLKTDLAEAEKRQSLAAFWVKGFKDLRLFLIEEALGALTIEVNNNLLQLGLRDWEIRFDVERETKSGSISKGFQVLVKSPTHEGEVPFEAWSGGEGQRLRLAGTMGLSNLILARKGIVSDIEVWDEPSQHLSIEGLLDLVDSLKDRAVGLNKRIWLVDHHVLDHGAFNGVWTVVKTADGSAVQQNLTVGE